MQTKQLVWILGLLLSVGMTAQSPNPTTTFNEGDYEACIAVCDELLKEDGTNSSAHYFKGASLVRMKQYEKGIVHLTSADEYNYQPAVAVQANLLRAHAGLKQTETVLTQLKELAENQFRNSTFLEATEFAYLKENTSFAELRQQVLENANPCQYNEGAQRLDFWLGEWDVYQGDVKTADSRITKGSDGCTLHEDYRTQSGFSGRSISYFDPSDELYKQTWVDKFNSVVHFTEVTSKPGYLCLEVVLPGGSGAVTRMCYAYDADADTVTQTLERSTDDRKTWTQNFEGIYKRKTTGIN